MTFVQILAQWLYFLVFTMLFVALALYIGATIINYVKSAKHSKSQERRK